MLFNEHDSEIKFILFLLFVLMIGICYIIKITTKYYSFCKYLDHIKSETFSKIVFILHLTVTVMSTLLLSNFLEKYQFYNGIIKQNPILEYFALIFLFIALLITFGICLNLIFCENITIKNERKIGSR
jgi:membrane protease YdiL (CAAX protease family)